MYGPVAFPLQATVYLSSPGVEYGGGEVVLTEQKPRAQTRVHVLTPGQGDVLVLPTHGAPIHGSRGYYKAVFRHGVATVGWGERFTLGIALHDANDLTVRFQRDVERAITAVAHALRADRITS